MSVSRVVRRQGDASNGCNVDSDQADTNYEAGEMRPTLAEYLVKFDVRPRLRASEASQNSSPALLCPSQSTMAPDLNS